jgi:hypothetical protein
VSDARCVERGQLGAERCDAHRVGSSARRGARRSRAAWPLAVAGYTSRETDDLRRGYTRKCAASRCDRRSSQLSSLSARAQRKHGKVCYVPGT